MFSKFVFVSGVTSYLRNEQIIFTDLWVFKIAPSHFCPFQWAAGKGRGGEILTDTKKRGCHFLSDARDKINSPLFQTGRPYQFPADTGQIQIQPVNKSKSNTCNKSCWPPRTNPAAAASDKSKCVRWTNRICAPTQIRALRPRPCKGGGSTTRIRLEHTWTLHSLAKAIWHILKNGDTSTSILFCHQDVLIECKKFL